MLNLAGGWEDETMDPLSWEGEVDAVVGSFARTI